MEQAWIGICVYSLKHKEPFGRANSSGRHPTGDDVIALPSCEPEMTGKRL